MQINTDIETLSKLYPVLEEVGLDALITGEGDLNPMKAFKSLFVEKKLVEVVQIITNDYTTDFSKMQAKDIGDILNRFFQGIKLFVPDVIRSYLGDLSVNVQKPISS